MAVRTAKAEWKGHLQDGNGSFESQSGAIGGKYSFQTRFEEEPGTNPEELIAAAHAACFSMALSGEIGRAGHDPESVRTEARVQLLKEGAGFAIKKIDLVTSASVPGMDDAAFQQAAEAAKQGCPISQALAAIPEITLDATLQS